LILASWLACPGCGARTFTRQCPRHLYRRVSRNGPASVSRLPFGALSDRLPCSPAAVVLHRERPQTIKEAKMATFNARAETVETKPFFRDAFKHSRCLIPISGYYEWQNTPSGKQPWYFTARDGSPLLTVAGLWDEWKNRDTGERLKSCTMIITEWLRKSTTACPCF
jgi:putative SOS response-associated peptidase YedK